MLERSDCLIVKRKMTMAWPGARTEVTETRGYLAGDSERTANVHAGEGASQSQTSFVLNYKTNQTTRGRGTRGRGTTEAGAGGGRQSRETGSGSGRDIQQAPQHSRDLAANIYRASLVIEASCTHTLGDRRGGCPG